MSHPMFNAAVGLGAFAALAILCGALVVTGADPVPTLTPTPTPTTSTASHATEAPTIERAMPLVTFDLDADAYVPTTPGSLILPPCAAEDSDVNCYWDAEARRNGHGSDFIVWDGRVFYP